MYTYTQSGPHQSETYRPRAYQHGPQDIQGHELVKGQILFLKPREDVIHPIKLHPNREQGLNFLNHPVIVLGGAGKDSVKVLTLTSFGNRPIEAKYTSTALKRAREQFIPIHPAESYDEAQALTLEGGLLYKSSYISTTSAYIVHISMLRHYNKKHVGAYFGLNERSWMELKWKLHKTPPNVLPQVWSVNTTSSIYSPVIWATMPTSLISTTLKGFHIWPHSQPQFSAFGNFAGSYGVPTTASDNSLLWHQQPPYVIAYS